MKVKVEPRNNEPGWMVRIDSGTMQTMRYVIPAGEQFVMVNPFASPETTVFVSTFEDGISEAVKSV
jgi:hypothetical protein